VGEKGGGLRPPPFVQGGAVQWFPARSPAPPSPPPRPLPCPPKKRGRRGEEGEEGGGVIK